MAQLTLTYADFTLSSHWTATLVTVIDEDTGHPTGEYRTTYSTPTTGTKTVSFDTSQIPSGATVTAATLYCTFSGSYGAERLDGTKEAAKNVLSKFSDMNGGTFAALDVTASYKATGYSGTGSTSGKTYYSSSTFTGISLVIDYTPASSSGTLDKESVDAGTDVTLTIATNDATNTHSVTWTFGSNTHTVNLAAGTLTNTIVVPLSWLNAIPNSTSGTATCELNTFKADGTQVGSKAYSFTIAAPASVVPTMSGFTTTRDNTGLSASSWDVYVQGKSKATLAITNAAGAYGSTISAYSITGAGYIGSAATFTTGFLNATGDVTFTGTITDSRGRTATQTVTVHVYPYAAPAFVGDIDVHRCASDGTESVMGTYLYVSASYTVSDVGGRNGCICVVEYRQGSTGGMATAVPVNSGTPVVIGGGNINIEYSYQVVLTLTDVLGSVQYACQIGSAAIPIHLKNGGKAVAFGQAATIDNSVTVNPAWAFYAGGKNLAALTPAMIEAAAQADLTALSGVVATKATTTTYTATVGTTWTGTEAPYTQSVSVPGLLATDTPIADVVLDGATYADVQAQQAAYALIYRMVANSDILTVYSVAPTETSVTVQLKVVR